VTNPHELEIKDLKKNFGFNPLDLEDYIHKTQIPNIKTYDDHSLIILDFPFFKQNGNNESIKSLSGKEKTDKHSIANLLNIPHAALSSIPLFHFSSINTRRILTSHVNLFIGKEYIVVLHEGVLTPIDYIFSQCQQSLFNRNNYMCQGNVYLAYKIIDALLDACFPIINELIIMIEKIDQELESKKTQAALEEISITRRNIVFFQTMIKPVLPIFKHLEEQRYEALNGPITAYWTNIHDHLKKIAHRLEDSGELIKGISESNESLIASKTNEIIKVLTIFSAIILPLNLIASIYGMNVAGLPLAQDPISFFLLLIFMTIMGIIMLIVFRTRRWF
jgi:magnesium transporter